jgi:hypothetical protein
MRRLGYPSGSAPRCGGDAIAAHERLLILTIDRADVVAVDRATHHRNWMALVWWRIAEASP